MSDTTDRTTDESEDQLPTVAETLEDLAHLYLRTVVSPQPVNPATLGWQGVAGTLAALSLQTLHFLNGIDPKYGQAFADFYHGPLGEGPHQLAVGMWIERNVATPAGAEVTEWVERAEKEAEAAFAQASRPVGVTELAEHLGDDVLSLLATGLGASWKQWKEHGSAKRNCFVPGCLRELDIVEVWQGKNGLHGEGWMSGSAVGFACPEHAGQLWANDKQHIPSWSRPTTQDTTALECTCGWSSGPAAFRQHGTVLYQVHALEALGLRR